MTETQGLSQELNQELTNIKGLNFIDALEKALEDKIITPNEAKELTKNYNLERLSVIRYTKNQVNELKQAMGKDFVGTETWVNKEVLRDFLRKKTKETTKSNTSKRIRNFSREKTKEPTAPAVQTLENTSQTLNEYKFNSNGELINNNGDKFTGRGVYIRQDGAKYDGEWKDCMANGRGVYILQDGTKYDGEWRNNKAVQTLENTSQTLNEYKFNNNWELINNKGDKFTGRGVYIWQDGTKYDGEWKDGMVNGRGRMIYANGDTYEGERKDGMMNGRGVYILQDGTKYEGKWINNKMEGEGRVTYFYGSIYEGELENGMMNGRGRMIYASGDIYDGEWKNGMMNGRGRMTYASGDTYEGEWKNGFRIDGQDVRKYTLSKEDFKNEYILSKEDFKNYFEGEDFQQQNIGNCWLVAAIDSLVSYADYEDLIRKSVKKINEGFEVIIPLGSPIGQGTPYSIKTDDYKNQISITGKKFSLVYGKEGILALMIAYGKFSTGKKDEDFDLMKLEGGDGSTCFNTLVYGVNSYSKERNISKRKRLYCLGRERSNRNSRRSKEADDRQNFVNELKIALKNFSPETLMTVGINQGKNYNELLPYNSDKSYWHEISVEEVTTDQKGEISEITLSNPRDSSKSYKLSFDELLNSCIDYGMSSKNSINGLTRSNATDRNNRVLSSNVRRKDREPKSLNDVILKFGWLSGSRDVELSESKIRGDVIVEEQDGIIKIKSRGRDATLKRNPSEPKSITMSIGNKSLNLPISDFSQEIIYFYIPMLTVFINAVRYYFIDSQYVSKRFYIDNDGYLMFDCRTNSLPTDNITFPYKCLEDWSFIGIDGNNTRLKQKIVDFLNLFCV